MVAKRPGDRHKVPKHTLRVADEDLWERFVRKVADEGKTRTEVLVRLIRRYVDED